MGETEPARAFFILFDLPDFSRHTTRFEVKVPWMLGLIATRAGRDSVADPCI